jgi:FixJ family two-component response regulator
MSRIWLVDDDPSVLRGLERLLGAEGFETRSFPDAESFLAAHDPAVPGCAVIDLGLPSIDGLELQTRLAHQGGARPVVFLTGHGTVPTAVQAMRAGAVDFLSKPVDADTLLRAIRSALEMDSLRRSRSAVVKDVLQRVNSLTPREQEVLREIVLGRMNKQIAHHLGAAEKTIKVHRGRVMQKMGVRSVAELVKLMAALEDDPAT